MKKNRKQKRGNPLRRTPATQSISTVTTQSATSSQSKGIAETAAVIIGNLSQLVLVGLVIFGYFWTVKPAFQLQVLQEDQAKQELALNRSKEAEQKAIANRLHAETALASATKSLSLVNKQKSAQEEALRTTIARATAVDTAAQKTARLLAIELEELDRSKRLVMRADFDHAYAWDRFAEKGPRLNFSDNFLDGEAVLYDDPYQTLLKALDKLAPQDAKEERYPVRLLNSLRKHLQDRKAALVCFQPDFSALKASFDREVFNLEPIAVLAAKTEKERVIEEHRKARETPIFTEDWDAQNLHRQKLAVKFLVQALYSQSLAEHRNECDQKAAVVAAELEALILPKQ